MARIWNEVSGPRWVRYQAALDAQLAPLGDAVLALAALTPGEHVLDVGTGSGALALAASDRVGASGRVTGVDLSAPLLDAARQRSRSHAHAATHEWLQRDAQTDDLGVASVDVVVSRFGVMFFSDPTAAFEHLRRATRAGGRLAYVCWQRAVDNAWVEVPLRAALAHVPPPPEFSSGTGGPFSMADADATRGLLVGAGWSNVQIAPWTGQLSLGGGLSLEASVALLLDIGPTARALHEAGEGARGAVTAAVTAALAPHYDRTLGVTLGGAAWLVSARNPGAAVGG